MWETVLALKITNKDLQAVLRKDLFESWKYNNVSISSLKNNGDQGTSKRLGAYKEYSTSI